MPYEFTISEVLPATPRAVYDAWMSSDEHAAMTGGAAEIDARVGGDFTAWDGYITGRTIALEPGRRIVQAWRTSDFEPAAHDSQIEVLLEAVPEGTKITLHQTAVPDGQSGYEEGWQENYFDPMREYFASGDK